jgi:exosortase A-associated hydrolase 1
MRKMICFECAGGILHGTLDEGTSTAGLLIVSGGNEIRSGAYAGQASLAANFARNDTPVFRYDRRGIGDSEGTNNGFESTAEDIAAAVAAFRKAAPHITRIVAFGNCDAASALALFHESARIDALILANPWVIETTATAQDAPTKPSAAAIRARYIARIKNPRSLIDLLTGKINLKKLAGGIASASRGDEVTGLAQRISAALTSTPLPVNLLIARRDTTAMAFMGAWHDDVFKAVRARPNIQMEICDTASHSFAGGDDQAWLTAQIKRCLKDNGSEGGT